MNLLGEWRVHGGTVVIGPSAAVSTGVGDCERPCTEWVFLSAVQVDDITAKLAVTGFTTIDDNGKTVKTAREDPAATGPAIGNYYTVQLLPDGAATTRLFDSSGKPLVAADEANGLGNPYLCRTGKEDEAGHCGA